MSQLVFGGISPYTTTPNRYPYWYHTRPVNTLYGAQSASNRIASIPKNFKPFPLTDRSGNVEWCSKMGVSVNYTGLLQDRVCYN